MSPQPLSPQPRVNIHPDFEVLAATTAARLITRLVDVQNERGDASVVLTGGSVGTATLAAVAASPACPAVDWTKVNFWWGDERFLPTGHPDRNEVQADEALLSKITTDPHRVHRFPASDVIPDLDKAADHYAAELAEFAGTDESDEPLALPRFDVLLLGVGPDAHVASLFPEGAAIRERERVVVPVRNSPKPPPERLTLTLPAINSAQEVWLVVSGTDKAGAVGLALAGAGSVQVPAAGPAGAAKTLWLIDHDAAADVPRALILPGLGLTS